MKFKNLFIGTVVLALTHTAVNAQTFDWAKGIGGSLSDEGQRVATDGSGNVYVTGYFYSSTIDFNPGGSGGSLTNVGTCDIFLAKYDTQGGLLWAKNMGGSRDDRGYGVAVDGSGNVYVTGQFLSDTADFNRGGSGGKLINAGGYDVFLAKYDTGGSFLWAKSMGGDGEDYGYDVTADESGNVYLTGYFFSKKAEFNPGSNGGTLTNVGGADIFLAKYDAGGSFLWVKGIGSSSGDYGYGVAVDQVGNVFVTGTSRPSANFNPGGNGGTPANAGGSDAFLAKYDAGGNFLWVKSMGGNSSDYGYDVAVDKDGNAYVTGFFFSSTAEFNPGGSSHTLKNAGGSDLFLAKFDTGGNLLWAENMGGDDVEYCYGIAIDKSNNVYLTGYFFSKKADFNPNGGGTLTNSNTDNTDVFLAKYNGEGNFLWAKSMGGNTGDDMGWGVVADGSGNAYVAGTFFSKTADFNPGGSGGMLTTTENSSDVFLVKFSCSDTSSSYIPVSLPCGETYTLNDSVYTATGIYTLVFPNTSGCDSTVTLDLIIAPLDQPIIKTDSFTLSVSGTYAVYQWLKDGIPVDGANDSIYAVTANGNYQVVVTNEHGCSDTSDIYPVTNYPTGIDDAYKSAGQIKIYPNPASAMIYIQSLVEVTVQITDISGKVIKEYANATSAYIGELSKGVYLLHISDRSGVLLKVEKMIKAE